jgi:hypothetical protein
MGRAKRESELPEKMSLMPEAFGVPPPVESDGIETEKQLTIDNETKNWSIDDLLRLSKKSCFYTNEEVEELRLIASHKLKFEILSQDCESKFCPNEEQFKQLWMILPKIDALRKKLSVAGSWDTLHEMFGAS